MSHYDCKRCGAYGCFGECEQEEKDFAEALKRADMSSKDYYLMKYTRDVIRANYPATQYTTGLALKSELDKLNARLAEVK
jgi:hypothetical protein